MAECQMCGAPLFEGAAFCGACGAPVPTAAPPTSATPAPAPPTEPPAYSQPLSPEPPFVYRQVRVPPGPPPPQPPGLAVAGFCCSLAGIVLLFVPVIGLMGFLGVILGVVFSLAGMSEAKKRGAPSGLAVAGLVIGLVGLGLSIASLIACGSLLALLFTSGGHATSVGPTYY